MCHYDVAVLLSKGTWVCFLTGHALTPQHALAPFTTSSPLVWLTYIWTQTRTAVHTHPPKDKLKGTKRDSFFFMQQYSISFLKYFKSVGQENILWILIHNLQYIHILNTHCNNILSEDNKNITAWTANTFSYLKSHFQSSKSTYSPK